MAHRKLTVVIWGIVAVLVIIGSIFADDIGLPDLRLIVVAASLVVLAYTGSLIIKMNKLDPGTELMQVLAGHIRDGAQTFLRREYKVLIIFTVVLGALLALLIEPRPWVAVGYVVGTAVSALASWIGMSVAVRANVRTASAARHGWGGAMMAAFGGGSIMAFSVVGLGLLTLTLLTMIFQEPYVWLGFVFGSTSVALFLRVGGGIFTKSADVGADLVGKVEIGIPEDDARNPAVIADNVGDNVGDIAGMGSDLYESYVSALVAAMVLGQVIYGEVGTFVPLLLGAIGLLSSLLGNLFVSPPSNEDAPFETQVRQVHQSMNRGVYISNILLVIGAYLLLTHFMPQQDALALFGCVVAGLATGFIIGPVTEYYTSEHKPVMDIAQAANSGPAILIMEGMAIAKMSTVIPIIVIAIATVVAFSFAGLLGIAIASVGMMANLGMLLSMDGYGPITDNAAGIAEMAHMEAEVRERCELLDAVGNSTAALAKGFAIASAALAALAWLATYFVAADITIVNIEDPQVVAGLFIGAMMVYLFSSLTMRGVSKGAFAIVKEVRRQFREIKGLLEGTATPDYVTCVDIATVHALHSMLVPGVLCIIIPLVLGVLLTSEAVAGLLMGALLVGLPLAIYMANAGGAWDNAKKHIEAGHHGGKGSEAHKASVIGDTLGDPLKDTVGPSLDILIKLVGKMAVMFAPLFGAISLLSRWIQ
jgi:K(+)-stimulated pyrophosphate-energized sodium pump